jgi:hypothetical protein
VERRDGETPCDDGAFDLTEGEHEGVEDYVEVF